MTRLEKNPTWMAVVAVRLVDVEGRWLLNRRPLEKHHGGLWEFPGGKVEAGETPAQALVREAKEELSVLIRIEDLVPETFAQESSADGRAPIVILLYTCASWSGEPQPLEGGELGWFQPHEATKLDRPPLDIALMNRLLEKIAD